MSEGDTSVILKAASEELAANAEILDKFLIPDDDPPVLRFEDVDLDRAKADAADAETLATISADKNLYTMASVLARINEEHRIRRDRRITNIGHRDLMLSGLRILSMRKKSLLKLVQN